MMGQILFKHCASCQDKQTDGAMLPNVPHVAMQGVMRESRQQ
jgi:hypothetical protein